MDGINSKASGLRVKNCKNVPDLFKNVGSAPGRLYLGIWIRPGQQVPDPVSSGSANCIGAPTLIPIPDQQSVPKRTVRTFYTIPERYGPVTVHTVPVMSYLDTGNYDFLIRNLGLSGVEHLLDSIENVHAEAKLVNPGKLRHGHHIASSEKGVFLMLTTKYSPENNDSC